MSLTDGSGLSATDIMALTGNSDGFGGGFGGGIGRREVSAMRA